MLWPELARPPKKCVRASGHIANVKPWPVNVDKLWWLLEQLRLMMMINRQIVTEDKTDPQSAGETCRWAGRQMERQADRPTVSWRDRQTDTQSAGETGRQTHSQLERQADRHTVSWRDRQTDPQSAGETGRQTHSQLERHVEGQVGRGNQQSQLETRISKRKVKQISKELLPLDTKWLLLP